MAGTKKADQKKDAEQELKAEEETREAAPEPVEQAQEDQEPVEQAQEDQEPETDMFANLPNPCVYCGPSVKGVARQYTTYQGGIHDALREFIRKHPDALRLIVSTGNFPEMRKRLERQGTPEAKLYKAVKAELQE